MIRTIANGIAALTLVAAPLAAQEASFERVHPFQQGVRYTIEALQDEASQTLRGRAALRYVNHSPDTLRRLYFHQYLNAFRPNSAWARWDLRHGNRTYQELPEEARAYERISRFVVDGTAVRPVYPGAPDSTVFFVELPAPLAPGDSLLATIDWTARLSTEPRRQGRQGRHYNWAHWYPRIAVYGPNGWEYRAHIRPGELNGTFGTYDVRLDLPADQVVGATGVPVEGDPGWADAAIEGSEAPRYLRGFYGRTPADPVGLLPAAPAPGRKRVRWHAQKVHNFAWSASPQYRYLGGSWNGRAIHLLWQPSSRRWDPWRTMEEETLALDWIAELFGEYPWPQITVTDRVEGGATEYPMLYMTSGGAVIHETMHMIVHGVLANNEWREGWLDEGMATFLNNWLLVERGADPDRVWGRTERLVSRLDAMGRSEPVGLPAAEFGSYPMYSTMTYEKGALVLRMLRDELGESTFREGLRTYYELYRFRQVTATDFQRVMEDVSGRDLDVFFHRWIETSEGRIGG